MEFIFLVFVSFILFIMMASMLSLPLSLYTLIAANLLIIAGMLILIFSTRIGTFLYEGNLDLQEDIVERFKIDKSLARFLTGGYGGLKFPIWLVRIIGVVIIGLSVY